MKSLRIIIRQLSSIVSESSADDVFRGSYFTYFAVKEATGSFISGVRYAQHMFGEL
jgi:hypothetical protein